MTPGTLFQLSVVVIRPMFVQSWVNGTGCGVVLASAACEQRPTHMSDKYLSDFSVRMTFS